MKFVQKTIRFFSLVVPVILIALSSGCSERKAAAETGVASAEVIPAVAVEKNKPWSERMSLSIMKRNPETWMIDFLDEPRWNYTQGLVLDAMVEVSRVKGNPLYADYAKRYGDTMVYDNGVMRDYDIDAFNIDNIAPGPLMIELYEKTGEEKYKTAIETLHRQLTWQPRNTVGGYWHKLRYPWQMWLDGLYMGEPFHAEYAKKFNQPEIFDHIIHQFTLVEENLKDEETGLYYHGWDESRIQAWSDEETGLSKHFWSRGLGWYCMAMVDVLPHFPKDHPGRAQLIGLLDRTLQAVLKVKDPETHTWWQVMDMPGKEGNYLESTGTCMYTYAMIRGVNEGYLDEKYRPLAVKSYEGILKNFIRVDDDGEVTLTDGCAVAGLGGSPYRDGTFDYYIGEPIRDNDPKGLGPFIRASLEMEKNVKTSKL